MKKTLLFYGLFLAFTSVLLKTTEYWFWIKLNAFDIYGALLALIFLGRDFLRLLFFNVVDCLLQFYP